MFYIKGQMNTSDNKLTNTYFFRHEFWSQIWSLKIAKIAIYLIFCYAHKKWMKWMVIEFMYLFSKVWWNESKQWYVLRKIKKIVLIILFSQKFNLFSIDFLGGLFMGHSFNSFFPRDWSRVEPERRQLIILAILRAHDYNDWHKWTARE